MPQRYFKHKSLAESPAESPAVSPQRRQSFRQLATLLGAGLLGATGLQGCGSTPRLALNQPLPEPLRERETGSYEVALVLGSGGPRGFAHIGVIRGLLEMGIKPDLIVGTSIGSVIGALYASGMPISKIWQLVLESNLMNWIGDLTWHRFGWVTGDSIERDIDWAVGGRSIEELPIRFVAVATRVPTGERTEFARGNVGAAVRASSSIVGTFIPVKIGDHVYSDGDLVAPVPVLTAKRLGAKRIIAVDVSANLSDTPDWANIFPSWVANGIMREQMIMRELAQADVPIRVQMNYFATATYGYKEYARDCGARAIEAARPRLRELGMIQ